MTRASTFFCLSFEMFTGRAFLGGRRVRCSFQLRKPLPPISVASSLPHLFFLKKKRKKKEDAAALPHLPLTNKQICILCQHSMPRRDLYASPSSSSLFGFLNELLSVYLYGSYTGHPSVVHIFSSIARCQAQNKQHRAPPGQIYRRHRDRVALACHAPKTYTPICIALAN